MDIFAIISLAFLAFQFITVVVFVFFTVKYAKKFGSQKDFYSITCFVCLILAFVSKIILRSIPIIEIIYMNENLYDYLFREEQIDPQNKWVELYYLSAVVSTTLFYMAIAANSIRWIHLIRVIINKNRKPFVKFFY